MAKIKLTKNELKRQKESLKRFRRYLPMLLLKKKQLQSEIVRIHREIKDLADKVNDAHRQVNVWSDVFSQEFDLESVLTVNEIVTGEGNIAGINIPLFERVDFKKQEYDLMRTPLWVDAGIDAIEKMINLKANLEVYRKQLDILKKELYIVTQRVNLFEKIKIPQAQEAIRVIQIYLGDLQTADVVRGKITKGKLEKKKDAGRV